MKFKTMCLALLFSSVAAAIIFLVFSIPSPGSSSTVQLIVNSRVRLINVNGNDYWYRLDLTQKKINLANNPRFIRIVGRAVLFEVPLSAPDSKTESWRPDPIFTSQSVTWTLYGSQVRTSINLLD